MEGALGCIVPLLFFEVVVLGGKESFEVDLCFVAGRFASPFFACIVVETGSANCIVAGLNNLVGCECYASISGVLYTLIDFLEINIDWFR